MATLNEIQLDRSMRKSSISLKPAAACPVDIYKKTLLR
jgi:hypothetical protein